MSKKYAFAAMGLLFACLGLYGAVGYLMKLGKPPPLPYVVVEPATDRTTRGQKQRGWISVGLSPASALGLPLKPLTISVHGQQLTNVIPARFEGKPNQSRLDSAGLHLLLQLEHIPGPSRDGDTLQIWEGETLPLWGGTVENSPVIKGLTKPQLIAALLVMPDADVVAEIKRGQSKTQNPDQLASLQVNILKRIPMRIGYAWVYKLSGTPVHSDRMCMDGVVILGADLLAVSHCISLPSRTPPGSRPGVPLMDRLIIETEPLLRPNQWRRPYNSLVSRLEGEKIDFETTPYIPPQWGNPSPTSDSSRR